MYERSENISGRGQAAPCARTLALLAPPTKFAPRIWLPLKGERDVSFVFDPICFRCGRAFA